MSARRAAESAARAALRGARSLQVAERRLCPALRIAMHCPAVVDECGHRRRSRGSRGHARDHGTSGQSARQGAALAEERNYVSQLARDLGISRALQVHLRKLEAAGLVSADIEVSQDGKAMKFYEVTPFALHLTPKTIMVAARSLGMDSDLEADVR